MVKVIANERGFFGGELRDAGAPFDVPDEIWDDKKTRPKWVRLAAFGGKGDHDGDGRTGGTKPADDEGDDAGKKGKGKKGKGKAETVDAPTAEPFGDAPAPERVANEVNEATGATEPDWIAPPGGDTPVPADD